MTLPAAVERKNQEMARKKAKGRKGGRKKYQIEMTPYSIFVWTFILFFLLIWVFVLGIFMGRFYFPGAVSAISDIKEQIGKLPGMGDQNPGPVSPKKETSDPKLAFYDRLSSKKETAQKKTHDAPTVSEKPVTPVKQKPKPRASKPEPQPAVTPTPKPVSKPALKPEPKPEKTVANAKKEVRPAAGQARYTIQLASLELASQAEKLSNKLVNKGFPAYYYDVEIKGKTFYRVRCGRFKTRKEAAAFILKLKDATGVKGFVVKME